MIDRLANNIASQLEKEKLISHELREHYVYALITIMERMVTITTIITIGFFWDELVPSCIFLLMFFSLRKHTGGYHAKKYWQCYIETVFTYILMLSFSSIMIKYMAVVYVCLFIATIYISIIGTINHPNMEMDYGELVEAKKAARHMVLIQVGLILMMDFMGGNKKYICVMSIAIILCATLMIIAKITKQEVHCSETS